MARILVVDDEIEIADLIYDVLTQVGHNVVKISGAEAALTPSLEQIKDKDFDLFIIDVKMPEKSGPELLKELRERGIKTPAITITGYAENSPMDDFVSVIKKPFELQDLISAVKDALSHPREEGVDI